MQHFITIEKSRFTLWEKLPAAVYTNLGKNRNAEKEKEKERQKDKESERDVKYTKQHIVRD